MKTIRKIGKGRVKVLTFYAIPVNIETKYGKLREICVFWIRKKGNYISELQFLFDDGEKYIQKKIHTDEKFFNIVKKIKDDTMSVLQELELF